MAAPRRSEVRWDIRARVKNLSNKLNSFDDAVSLLRAKKVGRSRSCTLVPMTLIVRAHAKSTTGSYN